MCLLVQSLPRANRTTHALVLVLVLVSCLTLEEVSFIYNKVHFRSNDLRLSAPTAPSCDWSSFGAGSDRRLGLATAFGLGLLGSFLDLFLVFDGSRCFSGHLLASALLGSLLDLFLVLIFDRSRCLGNRLPASAFLDWLRCRLGLINHLFFFLLVCRFLDLLASASCLSLGFGSGLLFGGSRLLRCCLLGLLLGGLCLLVLIIIGLLSAALSLWGRLLCSTLSVFIFLLGLLSTATNCLLSRYIELRIL